jgi:hypothetical protein
VLVGAGSDPRSHGALGVVFRRRYFPPVRTAGRVVSIGQLVVGLPEPFFFHTARPMVKLKLNEGNKKRRKQKQKTQSKADQREAAAAASQAAAAKAAAAAQREEEDVRREAEEKRAKEIADIQHELHDLPGAWASVSTQRGLRIFCASSAQLLPYDLARMDRPNDTLSVPLFDLNVTDAALELRVLGRDVEPAIQAQLVGGAQLAADKVAQPAPAAATGSTAAAAASTGTNWPGLLVAHGYFRGVLSVLQQLCTGFVPCSGIPIDEIIQEHLERRAQSVWSATHAGCFFGRNGTDVVARVESFPGEEAHDMYRRTEYLDLAQTIRTTACARLVPGTTTVNGVMCEICKKWETGTLRKTVKQTSAFADFDSVTAPNSRVSYRRLAQHAPMALQARAESAVQLRVEQLRELKNTATSLRIAMEKRSGESVTFSGGIKESVSQIFIDADEAVRKGDLEDDPGTKALFAKGSMFRSELPPTHLLDSCTF